MIAVLFETTAVPEKQDRYFELAEQLKPLLSHAEGFISVERFQSISNPEKFLSLSWWENEEAILQWKHNMLHRSAQQEGKGSIFSFYQIQVLSLIREYSSSQ
ncbi:antibiotic biosynthesis monooxygenase family protein [Photobacterium salinisoli]|uniref:antibiotic biosynthesis monooxygenase family protein n=1 Tax=Photobacterium salinisoli TaxID=1616783 RepID=UPI000EA21F70|nr:antibiotic biosynthesis monooxygenase [Photobacterium salinisoli]